MRRRCAALRRDGTRIALVPTMGALHAGHLSLLDIGRPGCGAVAVSIFVNPLQFGPREDLARYPRDLDADLARLERAGCDLVFAPESADMLGEAPRTFVEVEGWSDVLCGATRPGHFRGVATIVTKLFHVVGPDVAVFGLKDAQQALLLRRMVRDLDLDIELRFGPTARDPDGLAMSSRNAYLSPTERSEALLLYEALGAGRALLEAGEHRSAPVIERVRAVLERGPRVQVEYVEIVDLETLERRDRVDGNVLLAVAARVGTTRLIDNLMLRVTASGVDVVRLADTMR